MPWSGIFFLLATLFLMLVESMVLVVYGMFEGSDHFTDGLSLPLGVELREPFEYGSRGLPVKIIPVIFPDPDNRSPLDKLCLRMPELDELCRSNQDLVQEYYRRLLAVAMLVRKENGLPTTKYESPSKDAVSIRVVVGKDEIGHGGTCHADSFPSGAEVGPKNYWTKQGEKAYPRTELLVSLTPSLAVHVSSGIFGDGKKGRQSRLEWAARRFDAEEQGACAHLSRRASVEWLLSFLAKNALGPACV